MSTAAIASDDAACPNEASIMDILDEGIAPTIRQANVELLQALARLPACEGSRYELANLLLHGADLPGNPLPKDLGRARELLEGHGLEGHAFAFAQLAELALAEGDAVEAMQWTQVYLYVLTHYKTSQDADDRRGYNANLLQRAQVAWRKAKGKGEATPGSLLRDYLGRTPAVRERATREYQAQHEIAQAVKSEAGFGESGLRVKHRRYEADVNFRLPPGYAIYLLEVQPGGQVSRIAVESFAPTAAHAQKLRPLVEGWEYYPHRGEKAEILRVPVIYGDPRVRLRSR